MIYLWQFHYDVRWLLLGPSLQEMAGLGTLSCPWEPDVLGTEQYTFGCRCHFGSLLELRYGQRPLPSRLTGTLLDTPRAKKKTGLIPLWLNKG